MMMSLLFNYIIIHCCLWQHQFPPGLLYVGSYTHSGLLVCSWSQLLAVTLLQDNETKSTWVCLHSDSNQQEISLNFFLFVWGVISVWVTVKGDKHGDAQEWK